jgi:hypothetical protein
MLDSDCLGYGRDGDQRLALGGIDARAGQSEI